MYKSNCNVQFDCMHVYLHAYMHGHYGPGVDSASKRNEYQEHFLGVKAAGA